MGSKKIHIACSICSKVDQSHDMSDGFLRSSTIHAEKHCPTMILKSDRHVGAEVWKTSAVSAGARQYAREVLRYV
jgi:hypothetical protein